MMAFPSSFAGTICSSISFLAIVLLLSNHVLNSQASEGVVIANQYGIGLQNEDLQFFKMKSIQQEDTIEMLKRQLENHEVRVRNLEKSQSSPTDSIKKNEEDSVSIDTKREKRVSRLVQINLKSNEGADDNSTNKKKPSSCEDLKVIGHTLNGFYMVQGKDMTSSKLISVYCDFDHQPSNADSPSSIVKENLLGFIDIKSSSSGVYFYVQRNSSAVSNNKGSGVIRYDVQRLNLGGAMNGSTGVFTVPKSGIYHLEFVGLKMGDFDQLVIHLRVNGVRVASSFSGFGPVIVPVAIHSTLKLKSGDRVDVIVEKGGIVHCNNHCNHFTGWLLEEERMVPL